MHEEKPEGKWLKRVKWRIDKSTLLQSINIILMGKERKIRIWSSKSSITDYSLIPPGTVLISSKNFLEIDRREGGKK